MPYINPITEFYKTNELLQTTKLSHYFDLYWKSIMHKVDDELKILEIGVRNGGSLLCWDNVFPNSIVYGVDINPKCKSLEEYGFKIFIGDQSDNKFWNDFNDEVGGFDIIIDDGSHVPSDIIKSFDKLFPKMNNGGFYIIEDISHIEVYKHFTKYVEQSYKPEDPKKNNIMGISFYNRVIVIEKIPENNSVETIHSGSIAEHSLPVGISYNNWKKKCNEE